MITFTQLIEAAESERIEISSNLVLFKKRKNAYVPYLKTESGSLTPIRGKDKRGFLVWRTYKSVDEAKKALLGEDYIKNLGTNV